MKPIYFDYAATTPIDPRVVEKMLHFFTVEGAFGNPGSKHHFGREAKAAVDRAREQVAALIHAEPSEMIWTSGATEANNLALKGAAQLYQRKGRHIVTVKTEHKSVLDSCQQLEKEGFQLTYLTPEKNGLIDKEQFHAALRADTILVSMMHVHNELGIVQDIAALSELTAERGILFHVDAVQTAGKTEFDVQKIPVDLLSLSAHKAYGPKGIGALYVRKKPRVRVEAQIHGGGQEQGMRSGTLATHQIVGMGEAFYLAAKECEHDTVKIHELRDRLIHGLKNITLNTDLQHSIPHITNIHFPMPADELLKHLPYLAVSVGSACQSGEQGPSYVLRALGKTDEEARSALRFSLGRMTTHSEVDAAIKMINEV